MLWFTLMKLRSKNYETRSTAIADATRRGDTSALLRVIEDSDDYLRGDVIQALGEIGSATAVPALIKRLKDVNFNNQEAAAAALARIRDDRAISPLVELLRSTSAHPQTRAAAAKALGEFGDAKSAPGLLKALEDVDPSSRCLALEVLSFTGNGRSVPMAVAALHDSDANVRRQALKTLSSLPDSSAVEPLLHLLARITSGQWPFHEEIPNTKTLDTVTIVDALGRIGDARASPALEALLHSPILEVRRAAAKALDMLGWWPANDELYTQYAFSNQRWEELINLGWDKTRLALQEALSAGDSDLRCNAVIALKQVGGCRATASLIGALADDDSRVAGTAASALAEVGDAHAVAPLIDYCLGFDPGSGYLNDPTRPTIVMQTADTLVGLLVALVQRQIGEISYEDLRKLAELRDRKFKMRVDYDSPAYGQGADDYVIALDFSRVRELAERERHRRDLTG